MEVNNLGVEEATSEEESQPRSRRRVTDCASSSIGAATETTVPSPAATEPYKTVVEVAEEIKEQLARFRAGSPVLLANWEYNSRDSPG